MSIGSSVSPAEIHRRDDVGHVGASDVEERPLVDHRVVELARLLVFRVVAADDWARRL
jgi:hypothetical protein